MAPNHYVFYHNKFFFYIQFNAAYQKSLSSHFDALCIIF